MAVPLVHLIPLLLDRGESIAVSGSLMFVAMLAARRRADPDRNDLRSYRRARRLRACGLAAVDHRVLVRAAAVPCRRSIRSPSTFGFGFGGVMTALVLCVRASVPRVWPGSARLVRMFAWGGMGFGGYQGGYCFDLTGSYAISFLSAALAEVANLLVVAGFLLHRRWHADILRALRTPNHSALALVPRKSRQFDAP